MLTEVLLCLALSQSPCANGQCQLVNVPREVAATKHVSKFHSKHKEGHAIRKPFRPFKGLFKGKKGRCSGCG